MRIYIAGPMTGYKLNNKAAFDKAAASLKKAGHSVVNPPAEDAKLVLNVVKRGGDQGTPAWGDCMRRDIKDMMSCKGIHLLKGWERSRGASLEVLVGKEVGLVFVDSRGRPTEPPNTHSESVLLEAERIIHGPRQAAYGHPIEDFTRTGEMWGALLGMGAIEPEVVGLMMVLLKASREMNRHTRDNLVDMAGYAGTIDLIVRKRDEMEREAMKERMENG